MQMSAAAIYSIDCPLSAFSLSASFGRIFVFDPAVFVLATSGKRQKEGDVSLSLSLSPSPFLRLGGLNTNQRWAPKVSP